MRSLLVLLALTASLGAGVWDSAGDTTNLRVVPSTALPPITDVRDAFFRTTPIHIRWETETAFDASEVADFLDTLEPWQAIYAKVVRLDGGWWIFYPVDAKTKKEKKP